MVLIIVGLYQLKLSNHDQCSLFNVQCSMFTCSMFNLSLKIAKKGKLERQSLFSPLLESAPKDLPRTMSQVSEERLESSFDL